MPPVEFVVFFVLIVALALTYATSAFIIAEEGPELSIASAEKRT